MKKANIRKLALAGLLIALGVACAPFSVPVGASKCFPVQHLVNVLAAAVLGPFYGVVIAFCTSLIRVLTGTGSLLAFPGSMCGALLCGLTFRFSKNLPLTCIAEAVGTGVLGAIAAWPVAIFLMGKEAALFTYILPFFVSSAGGAALAGFLLAALRKTNVLKHFAS